ncbi:MAG TPA: glycosyltransferase, partial [Bryobacteraceae bacterium]|nr:glycosyltransferase [Bryobacteraceae bacterium]
MDSNIVLAANSCWNLINFRAPIIARLQAHGYKVSAAVPRDDAAPLLEALGVTVHDVPIDPRGLSPIRDARLAASYWRLFRRLRPAAVLAFTPKPNIYAGLA